MDFISSYKSTTYYGNNLALGAGGHRFESCYPDKRKRVDFQLITKSILFIFISFMAKSQTKLCTNMHKFAQVCTKMFAECLQSVCSDYDKSEINN